MENNVVTLSKARNYKELPMRDAINQIAADLELISQLVHSSVISNDLMKISQYLGSTVR